MLLTVRTSLLAHRLATARSVAITGASAYTNAALSVFDRSVCQFFRRLTRCFQRHYYYDVQARLENGHRCVFDSLRNLLECISTSKSPDFSWWLQCPFWRQRCCRLREISQRACRPQPGSTRHVTSPNQHRMSFFRHHPQNWTDSSCATGRPNVTSWPCFCRRRMRLSTTAGANVCWHWYMALEEFGHQRLRTRFHDWRAWAFDAGWCNSSVILLLQHVTWSRGQIRSTQVQASMSPVISALVSFL